MYVWAKSCTTASLSVIIRAFIIKSQYPVVELPLKFVLDYRFFPCVTLINNYFFHLFICSTKFLVFFSVSWVKDNLKKFTHFRVAKFLEISLPFTLRKTVCTKDNERRTINTLLKDSLSLVMISKNVQ